MLEKIKRWLESHPYWMLTFVTLAALTPFLAKPFNMDDPLFIWAAQQIHAHPLNPYGFDVNWYGTTQPMWSVTENPPLSCYYLALTGTLLGWSEMALHLACLLPAIAVVLGTYRLAKNFCNWPRFAALATLFGPGFLVSSTTVMCDVSLLAFWVWAVVFWIEGIKQDDFRKLSIAGSLMALALLTKYYGICLVPLLGVHGWLEKRTVGRWATVLLIPLAAICAYEWITLHLYGQPLFFTAVHYVKSAQTGHVISTAVKVLNALTFTGGCFAITLFCSPFLWRKSTLSLLASSAILFTALIFAGGMMMKNYNWLAANIRIAVEIQIIFWSISGVCVLALALADIWQKRDAVSGLLTFWVLGTFTFAGLVNWTVNTRSVLPMAPAVAILLARRLQQNKTVLSAGITFSMVASAALSLLTTQSDYLLAKANRQNAKQISAQYASLPGTLWFQGHWGFGYYMQSFGASALDRNDSEVQPGDVLVTPSQNTNFLHPDPEKTISLGVFTTPVFPWYATWCPAIGAGFYASIGGPLPFAFGPTPSEKAFADALKPRPVNPK